MKISYGKNVYGNESFSENIDKLTDVVVDFKLEVYTILKNEIKKIISN